MIAPQRNQLVWLVDAGWQQVLERAWDVQAQDILSHWHEQQLPLVVCLQRVPGSSSTISLGLPAPLQWLKPEHLPKPGSTGRGLFWNAGGRGTK